MDDSLTGLCSGWPLSRQVSLAWGRWHVYYPIFLDTCVKSSTNKTMIKQQAEKINKSPGHEFGHNCSFSARRGPCTTHLSYRYACSFCIPGSNSLAVEDAKEKQLTCLSHHLPLSTAEHYWRSVCILSILGHLKMCKSTEDVLEFCANIAISYVSDQSLCRFSCPPGDPRIHAFMVSRLSG